jgi:phage/plasmid-associated DNA primase
MTTRTVSQVLLEDFSIVIRPGAKGECPQCHNKYFSLKPDDSLGKCFHPPCGHFLTTGRDDGQYRYSLTRVLESVYQDCHQELLHLATGQQNAYTYVHEERGIHPQVIADAMLGAVPSVYDVTPHFQPVLAEAQAAITALQGQKRGRPTKQLEQAEKRLQDLQEAQQKLVDCLAHRAGWLMFFYTNAAHRLVALRLRQPYSHKFVSFKLRTAGVFGRELFSPYVNPANQAFNDFLLVVEGEFNALQLQSLTVRYQESTGQSLGYIHACAIGGVLVADVGTLKRITSHPVLMYDNDTNGAGFELVKNVQKEMAVEACTTPLSGGSKSDLDSYIRDFVQDHIAAWEGVKALIAERQPYGRIYAGTGEEFFDYPITGGSRKVFVPKLLADALMERQQYHYTNPALWVYKDGVYLRDEGSIHTDCMTLLGREWKLQRRDEAIAYVQDARRINLASDTPSRYLNLRNGLYDLTTDTLTGHTPAYFSTVQLPYDYDPTAICPSILAWLKEAMDGDQELIDVLRAYLKAIVEGNTHIQRILEIVGPRGSGKGTYLRLAQALVGLENTFITELKHLEHSRFELANTRFKRLICITDAEAYGGPISNLKALTGSDPVRMEEKFVQAQTARAADGLVLIAANEEVQSSDYTSGLGRRRLTVYFHHVPTVPRHLLTLRGCTFQGEFVAELPGLLNWILAMPPSEMYELLSLDHQLTSPSLRANWAKSLLATNPLAAWANYHLIQDDGAVINVGAARRVEQEVTKYDSSGMSSTTTKHGYYAHAEDWLYPSYAAYADRAGFRRISLQKFAGLLHDLLVNQLKLDDIHHTDDMHGSRFHGVRLRTKDDNIAGIPLLL